VPPNTVLPAGRGGHTLFAFENKLYSYGGWNSESQFNNVIVFDLNTLEWSDPDIYNDVSRWNHSAVMVEAIPTWKYFIFGGESTNFAEGQQRTFGAYVNSSCFLDIGTMQWQEIKPESDEIPAAREYAACSYDSANSRFLIFGGWNNGWLNDMWSLAVNKIVGPSYAIMEIDPPLGQLTGGVPVTIKGVGFRDQTTKIYFTVGKNVVDTPGKFTCETTGTFVSDTELTAITPNFEQFGPKECTVQLAILGNELTTTSVSYSYFLNTRAHKSLAFGNGLLRDLAIGEPVEFIIQARNDEGHNRSSGRDIFQVTIKHENGTEIPCEIDDHDDGQYFVRFQCEVEGSVNIAILFQDDKQKMVPLRGSPYSAHFCEGVQANTNQLNGPTLPKYVTKMIEQSQTWMKESSAAANTKDKDLTNIKTLIGVVDAVNAVHERSDQIMLQLDQLEETLNYLATKNSAKESQIKTCKKLFDEWTNLKKLAKDIKKEVAPLVATETQRNTNQIAKLEEDMKGFGQDLKKREFYKYDCGREAALQKLDAVYAEVAELEEKITNYGHTANKFGKPEIIDGCNRQADSIRNEIGNMKMLWDHISLCQGTFISYLSNTWMNTDPTEMEDEVKKLMKTLKEMKVDKRANAYNGILEENKKWLIFLPLIAELRSPSMRERHWDALRAKVKSNFQVDEKLTLNDVFKLNLQNYKDEVEEITD
jgi:dynein heavy chain, axonemal